MLDAMAPTNTLAGNPAALREAFDTGGKSLVRGARNMLNDVRNNGGWPSQVDATGFEVGVNMAATPGAVVYRSDLIELIQYEPQVKRVHAVPLLFCPPWINKYYIMDLAPGKSLIEWAVQHGHTCFAISYRNPDSSMRDVDFEDYLRQGPLDALRVVREITGAPEVNTVSVCLGGTLTAIALAHNAAIGDHSIKSATFLNTLTDFSVPGALGVFTDEATIAGLEKQMAKEGFLDSDKMAHTFDALRANDLVFAYVVNNWLLGKKPPAFDLLVWNKDSTRMPAKMHSRYLRSCYLNNEFARGEFEIDGQKLLPGKVGRMLRDRALGIDARGLETSSERISISVEETFERDLSDRELLHAELRRMAEQLGAHLRRDGLAARTVTAKLRYGDFSIRSRSASLDVGIDDPDRIGELACALLDRGLRDRPGALRLVGVGVSGLSDFRQLSLDETG